MGNENVVERKRNDNIINIEKQTNRNRPPPTILSPLETPIQETPQTVVISNTNSQKIGGNKREFFSTLDVSKYQYTRLSFNIILSLLEYFPVTLEDESQLYSSKMFYGYFFNDSKRNLRLIFSSFYFVNHVDSINLCSIPFTRIKHLFFENPILIKSKFLLDCSDLVSLINVKINQKTLPSLSSVFHCMKRLDFRIYNINNQLIDYLNQMNNLMFLKINFRKRISNRDDIYKRLNHLKKLIVLELWNTSTYKYISIPQPVYRSLWKMNCLKSICLVRIKITSKHLKYILRSKTIEEFEYLGKLKNKMFDIFVSKDSAAISGNLKNINLSGCRVEKDFIKLFSVKQLVDLNLSTISIVKKIDSNEEKDVFNDDEIQNLLEGVKFDKNSKMQNLKLNRLSIPISFICKICFCYHLKNLYFEKCKNSISDVHLNVLHKNNIWRNKVNIYLNKKEGEEEFLKEIENIENQSDSKLVLIHQNSLL